ncbi:MAG: YcxB family protein [Clostridiales bacterium]|nr:YcxB family protein [Clostridiales bacterium]
MKKSKIQYTASITYDEPTIQKVFRAEYFTYDRLRIVIRALIGLALIAVALFTSVHVAIKVLCLLIGCWLIVAMDFPSKVKAEGVIEARNGAVSTVTLQFGESSVRVVEGKQLYKYTAVDRLVEEGDYFYIFFDRQNAVMLDKNTLDPPKPDAFRHFIVEKTGKKWQDTSLLLMNFRDLRQAVRDRLHRN